MPLALKKHSNQQVTAERQWYDFPQQNNTHDRRLGCIFCRRRNSWQFYSKSKELNHAVIAAQTREDLENEIRDIALGGLCDECEPLLLGLEESSGGSEPCPTGQG